MDPTYPLVPIANFLACALLLAVLSKNMLKPSNIGAFSLLVWAFMMGLATGINAIIWSNGVQNVAPVWCDIMTRVCGIGSASALSAACFVIVRRLYIATCRSLTTSLTSDKSTMLVDLSICIGCPLISIVLYSILQTNRFQIVEEIGCLSSPAPYGLSLLLIYFPASLTPLASLILYFVIVKAYVRHRREFKALQASGSTSSSQLVFRRLAVVGIIDIITVPPLMIFSLVWLIISVKDVPFWPGWNAVHDSDFWTIPTLTSEEWRSAGPSVHAAFAILQWLCPCVSIYFFVLFGLSEHKQAQYRSIYWKVVKPFGLTPFTPVEHSIIAFGPNRQRNSPAAGTLETTTITSQSLTVTETGPCHQISFNKAVELEEGRCEKFHVTTSLDTSSRGSTT